MLDELSELDQEGNPKPQRSLEDLQADGSEDDEEEVGMQGVGTSWRNSGSNFHPFTPFKHAPQHSCLYVHIDS